MENKFDSFKLKSEIYSNMGSIHILEQISGSKAFIVCDPIMKELGYLEKTIDCLNKAGISSVVFTDVSPDPDTKVVAKGMKIFEKSDADVVVAIGGGSAIDAAKGIMYFAWNMMDDSDKKRPQFIAIPSTSGTGSEVTNFTVITSGDEKVCVVDDYIAPDIAILDSTCISHVPKHVIADTGVDALVHAIEAYVSPKATDFTDALAEKAVKLIFDNIVDLYNDTNNSYARDRILNASCIAGMAFTNSGLGINHSLAHAFGGTFGVSHGRSNAILVDKVIEYNSELRGSANNYAAQKYVELAKILNLSARTCREGVANFIQNICELKRFLGIQDNISSLGIESDDYHNAIESMAETAMHDRCTPTNPKKPSKEDLIDIYQRSF